MAVAALLGSLTTFHWVLFVPRYYFGVRQVPDTRFANSGGADGFRLYPAVARFIDPTSLTYLSPKRLQDLLWCTGEPFLWACCNSICLADVFQFHLVPHIRMHEILAHRCSDCSEDKTAIPPTSHTSNSDKYSCDSGLHHRQNTLLTVSKECWDLKLTNVTHCNAILGQSVNDPHFSEWFCAQITLEWSHVIKFCHVICTKNQSELSVSVFAFVLHFFLSPVMKRLLSDFCNCWPVERVHFVWAFLDLSFCTSQCKLTSCNTQLFCVCNPFDFATVLFNKFWAFLVSRCCNKFHNGGFHLRQHGFLVPVLIVNFACACLLWSMLATLAVMFVCWCLSQSFVVCQMHPEIFSSTFNLVCGDMFLVAMSKMATTLHKQKFKLCMHTSAHLFALCKRNSKIGAIAHKSGSGEQCLGLWFVQTIQNFARTFSTHSRTWLQLSTSGLELINVFRMHSTKTKCPAPQLWDGTIQQNGLKNSEVMSNWKILCQKPKHVRASEMWNLWLDCMNDIASDWRKVVVCDMCVRQASWQAHQHEIPIFRPKQAEVVAPLVGPICDSLQCNWHEWSWKNGIVSHWSKVVTENGTDKCRTTHSWTFMLLELAIWPFKSAVKHFLHQIVQKQVFFPFPIEFVNQILNHLTLNLLLNSWKCFNRMILWFSTINNCFVSANSLTNQTDGNRSFVHFWTRTDSQTKVENAQFGCYFRNFWIFSGFYLKIIYCDVPGHHRKLSGTS